MFDILMAHAGRYTFSRVVGWDGYVRGTWDIVHDAFYEGLINKEEYMELYMADNNARVTKGE